MKSKKQESNDEDELWIPPAVVEQSDDSTEEVELFDTNRWRRDPNDVMTQQLEAVGLFPMWQPSPEQWSCKYGCPGVDIAGTRIEHSWNCPYWRNEGVTKTPFDGDENEQAVAHEFDAERFF